ncbi:FtsX-like permease family protein [Botrimarina mediterranea]|uniref:FtsX-like permease family protein n=1 Tax=Botrimarina mediterranea TaxID=2528022 RepID=UPI00118AC25B|nr:FtsX-like permease family protein [Planctomycetes bacterium K2D]
MSSSAVRLLLAAKLRSHPGRFIAAGVAIAFATALLLAALIGRQALRDQTPRAAQTLLGPAEVHLAATDAVHPFVESGLIESLRADPRVSFVATAVTVRAVDLPGLESGELDTETFYSLGDGGMGGWIPGRRDAFVAWDDDKPRGPVASGRQLATGESDLIEIAVPSVIWGQSVGSWRLLESDTGVHAARVVGILPTDMAMAASPPGIRLTARQISASAALKLAGRSLPPSDARVYLQHAEDKVVFLADWRPRLRDRAGRLEFWDSTSLQEAALRGPAAESARLAVQSAVLLAGACVVCIALSVQGNAVRERAAQSSLLRCLGANRKILAMLVLAEAITMAAISVLGAVLLVWAAMAGLAAYLPMLRVPSMPDLASIAMAAGVTLLGVLAGAAWPAIAATRRLPGDFDVEQDDPERVARFANRSAITGVSIAALAAAMISATPAQSFTRAELLSWFGVPCLALTALLATPLIIRWTSRLLVRPVGVLTRTESLVLADHVAADGARSAGAVIAIAIGLGGFIWMLCWGASMLESFIIDPAIPRWLVSIHPYGLDRDEAMELLSKPEFEEYHPLTLVDTHLNKADIAIPTLVMGIDVERSLGREPGSLPFEFINGDRESAEAGLKRGDMCLVSAWYAASHRTRVGDRLSVATPSIDGRAERTYRVAGILELRGWRMATKLNKVRLHGDKHTAMLVLDANAVRRDFPVADVNYLLGDTLPIADGSPSRFRSDLSKDEAYARSRDDRIAIESVIAEAIDLKRPVEHRPDGETVVVVEERVVQVDGLDRTRASLRGDWGGAAVKRMGQAPLLVLGLSLLSVSGALVGAFQARSRELGVLRCCGLTRWGLARLTIAEALLLGAAAIPVSVLLGGVGAAMMLEVPASWATGLILPASSQRRPFLGLGCGQASPPPPWSVVSRPCGRRIGSVGQRRLRSSAPRGEVRLIQAGRSGL